MLLLWLPKCAYAETCLHIQLLRHNKIEIIDNHSSVLSSCGLSMKNEDCNMPLLYWIPKLHKCPCKQRYISGGAECSTKSLSKILTSIFTVVKTGPQK